MIGKIYTPPVFFNNRISHDNATQPEKKLEKSGNWFCY